MSTAVSEFGIDITNLPKGPTAPSGTSIPYNKEVDAARKKELTKFLQSFQAFSPIFPNEFGLVVITHDNSTIGELLEKMLEHRIMALPIIHHETNKPLYVISMQHVMHYFLQVFQEGDFKSDFWHSLQRKLRPDKAANFVNAKIADVIGKINLTTDPLYTLGKDSKMYDVLKLMVEKRAHRVLINNADGELVNLITQSRILQLINVMVNQVPQAEMNIKALYLYHSRKLITISENKPAFEAFKLMEEKNVSGLPVVNEKGALVGNISINDLKLIGYDAKYWSLLSLPIKDYFKAIDEHAATTHLRSHALQLLHHNKEKDKPVVLKIKADHMFAYVISLINLYRVHRLYVVDDNDIPIGVVTLSDILNQIYSTVQE